MAKSFGVHSGLNSLNFAQFQFTISPIERLRLPAFKGSTLRGGFGTAFKQMVCLLRKESCVNCILKEKCAYCQIFESPRCDAAGIERKASHDPHPFVIEAPLEARQRYLPGERVCFNLILVGKGADYFPYFILAFEELGRIGIGLGKGNFQLMKVENLSDVTGAQGEVMYDNESQTVRTKYRVTSFSDVLEQSRHLNPYAVTLHFLTPTRIKQRGDLIAEMDFETFMRNLLRRLSWLSELYCGQKWDLDYAALLEQARNGVHTKNAELRWYDWERYSSRQNKKLKMGGFVGNITYEGEMRDFLPFVKMGEYLHIGQGTTFGLGKYIMEISGSQLHSSKGDKNLCPRR